MWVATVEWTFPKAVSRYRNSRNPCFSEAWEAIEAHGRSPSTEFGSKGASNFAQDDISIFIEIHRLVTSYMPISHSKIKELSSKKSWI